MKIITVVRQLDENCPVVSFTQSCIDENSVDDVDHYLMSLGNQHIEEFKEKFVEFKNAKFYCYISDI